MEDGRIHIILSLLLLPALEFLILCLILLGVANSWSISTFRTALVVVVGLGSTRGSSIGRDGNRPTSVVVGTSTSDGIGNDIELPLVLALRSIDGRCKVVCADIRLYILGRERCSRWKRTKRKNCRLRGQRNKESD